LVALGTIEPTSDIRLLNEMFTAREAVIKTLYMRCKLVCALVDIDLAAGKWRLREFSVIRNKLAKISCSFAQSLRFIVRLISTVQA
jgi:phosphopantetheinyl transferase (holo-ACP synthase)